MTAMTGHQLKTMRRRLGLGVADFGAALGYQGPRRNISLQVRRLECLDCLPIQAEARALALLKKESRRWNRT